MFPWKMLLRQISSKGKPRLVAGWRWVGLSVVVALVLAGCTASGSLVAGVDPASVVAVEFWDFSGDQDVAAGVFVCSRGSEVRVVSVEPVDVTGEVQALGAVQITGPAQGEGFLGSAYGFPPDGFPYDSLGSSPVAECGGTSATQVVVGVRRLAATGGGITGLVIRYSSGSVEKELHVPNIEINLCGDQGENCKGPASS